MPLLAVLEWSADPIAFQLGPLSVRWYGLLFGASFAFSFWFVRRAFAREGRPVEDAETLLISTLVATVVGARLMHCFAYEPERYLADPLSIFRVWEGGLASHGGMIGIVLAMWWHAHSRPAQPLLWLLDRVAVPVALASVMIRVGNFINSEIIGKPTDGTWGVVFSLRDNLPRHPAQLYEAAAYLALFVFLVLRHRRLGAATPHGLLTGWFLVICFTARIAVEFVKQRQEDFDLAGPFTVGQLLSVAPVAVGVWLIVRAHHRGPPPVAATAA